MRRPLLAVFIIIICISYLYTSNMEIDTLYDKQNTYVEGVVKQKVYKEKYVEYTVDDFLVRDYSKNRKINVGDKVEIYGVFNSLDLMNYDDFNYGKYIRSIGYKGIIYIKTYKIIGNNILYSNLDNIKSYIRNTSRYLYKRNSDFINSILIGEKQYLSKEEKNMFSRTGTSHIIALSGFHIGILCSVVIFFINGVNRVYKFIILIVVMFMYAIMVNMPSSIIRSIGFIILLYTSIFLDEKRDSISTLCLVGIIMTINNPYIIYNISFQLSFLATLSIIYFYGYINNIIKIKLISLTLSANILILPVIYYNFKGIAILSIIGNVIIVPFIGIIMYMGIISVILFEINILLAKLIASINMVVIKLIYFLLDKVSDLDFAYIDIDNPNKFYVIVYYIAVFSYMFYKELKVMKEQENELQGYY